ncbi:hypothetical protein D3C75_780320 [compost metagenome]
MIVHGNQYYRILVLHGIFPVRKHSDRLIRQGIPFGESRQGISGRLQLRAACLLRHGHQTLIALYVINSGEPLAEITDAPGQCFGSIGHSNARCIEKMQPVIGRIVHITHLIIVPGSLEIALQGERVAVFFQKPLRRGNAQDLLSVIVQGRAERVERNAVQ